MKRKPRRWILEAHTHDGDRFASAVLFRRNEHGDPRMFAVLSGLTMTEAKLFARELGADFKPKS